MKKIIPNFLLIIFLTLTAIMFVGCKQNKNTYSVTFMKASRISYSSYNSKITYTYISNSTIEIEKNEVIGTNNAPDTQYLNGRTYRFIGWYTDKEFNYMWDLSKDEVKSDLILYPRYQKIN